VIHINITYWMWLICVMQSPAGDLSYTAESTNCHEESAGTFAERR